MRSAVDLVLPAIVLVTWVLLLAVRRNVPPLFFAVASAVAVACFPIGAWVIARQPRRTASARCPRRAWTTRPCPGG